MIFVAGLAAGYILRAFVHGAWEMLRGPRKSWETQVLCDVCHRTDAAVCFFCAGAQAHNGDTQ